MGALVAGAHPIVGVEPVPERRALARELGADAVFSPEDAEEGKPRAHGRRRAAHLRDGRQNRRVRGRLPLDRAGWHDRRRRPSPPDGDRLTLDGVQVCEGRTIAGSYMGSTAPQRDVPRLLGLWTAGKLPVERLHSGSLALADINAGMDALASGRAVPQVVIPDGGLPEPPPAQEPFPDGLL